MAELANPAATFKWLSANPQEYIEQANWSAEGGKVLALIRRSDTGNSLSESYRIVEIDASTSAHRTVAQTPALRLALGDAPTVDGLSVEPTGLAVFTHFSRPAPTSYLLNLKTGQLSNLGNLSKGGANDLKWRPNHFVKTLPEFYQVWEQSDVAVALGHTSRASWLWGPVAFSSSGGVPGGHRGPPAGAVL